MSVNGPNISVIRLQVYYHLISDSFNSNTKRVLHTYYIKYKVNVHISTTLLNG